MPSLETEILSVVERVLKGREADLRASGLTARMEPLLTRGDGSTYESELVISIYRTGLEDVLEFHIVRAGQPVVTPAEIETWLFHELVEVMTRTRAASPDG
jgi:hypothetical protein